jgi:AraC-like DNA-binding protein
LLKDVPEKSPEEIQAMADILEVCAGEISEGSEDSAGMIRRMVWREAESKEQVEIPAKKRNSAAAGVPVATPGDSEHLLEKERLLFSAFRRGDNQTGGKILKELMDDIMTAIPFDFEIARFRAIELTVLLSRSAAGDDGDSLFEANNRYLGRIQESKTPEELIENLRLVAERLAGKIFSFQGVCHASVLRKAERYIWENYTRKISLREIAKAAGLSAPYFSTIFKEEMGENLSSYLNRLRVEKAANLLTVTGKSLNEIAGLCGFEDQSWFSKIFKSFTGVSPGKYRETGKGAPVFKNTGKKQEEEIT